MRSPYTNVWDRGAACIHFWDGRSIPGDIQVSGTAWLYRPARPLSSGADLMLVLPLRRLQASHISKPEEPERWLLDVVSTATHPGGGLAVTDWYIDIAVHHGYYKVENLGDFIDAVHQRLLGEQQMMQALRALENACEGLHRTAFDVPELLSVWDIKM